MIMNRHAETVPTRWAALVFDMSPVFRSDIDRMLPAPCYNRATDFNLCTPFTNYAANLVAF
jgi:hypothetical protein